MYIYVWQHRELSWKCCGDNKLIVQYVPSDPNYLTIRGFWEMCL